MPTFLKRFSFATDTEGWGSTFTHPAGKSIGWTSADNAPSDPAGGVLFVRAQGANIPNTWGAVYRDFRLSDFGVPPHALVSRARTYAAARCAEYVSGVTSKIELSNLAIATGAQLITYTSVPVYTSTTSWLGVDSGWKPCTFYGSDLLRFYVPTWIGTGNDPNASVTIYIDACEIEVEYSLDHGVFPEAKIGFTLNNGSTWVKIPLVTNLGFPELLPDEIELGMYGSRYKRYIMGLIEVGEITIECIADMSDNSVHRYLRQAQQNAEVLKWRIEVAQDRARTRWAAWEFNAWVRKWSLSVDRNDVARLSIALRFAGPDFTEMPSSSYSFLA